MIMAIKRLRQDFTTQKQSKRLLKMGVPADSADCLYRCKYDDYIYVLNKNPFSEIQSLIEDVIPCWSVGRLIKIIMLCHKQGILFFSSIRIYKTDVLANTLIEYLIKYMPDMDFSKLEE